MAALFTPEGEKTKKSQDKGQASPGPRAPAAPGTQKLGESGKAQDSLGNPFSPGYEGPLEKKKDVVHVDAESGAPAAIQPPGYQAQEISPRFIRLNFGWEKVLMAQKKFCEKAKGLFTKLEGPERYRGQKKSRVLERKYRGAILDVDMEEVRAAIEAAQRKAKAEDKKAS
jgi:hypothetical protein